MVTADEAVVGGRSDKSGRAAIFTDILARNALRREARLPLLDVRTTFDREVKYAEWVAHVVEHEEAARAEVLRDQRRRHGADYPQSTGGRWAVSILTTQALRRSFVARRSRRS